MGHGRIRHRGRAVGGCRLDRGVLGHGPVIRAVAFACEGQALEKTVCCASSGWWRRVCRVVPSASSLDSRARALHPLLQGPRVWSPWPAWAENAVLGRIASRPAAFESECSVRLFLVDGLRLRSLRRHGPTSGSRTRSTRKAIGQCPLKLSLPLALPKLF